MQNLSTGEIYSASRDGYFRFRLPEGEWVLQTKGREEKYMRKGVKKMIKKISAATIGVCMAVSAVGCQKAQKRSEEVVVPEYEDTSYIQLFADCPPDAGTKEMVQEYYDAGFTGFVLTEDDAALTDENGVLTEGYKKNLELISQYGDVYIRNHYNYPNNWDNPENTEVESYGGATTVIPKRSITTELNELGNVVGYYQADEPSYDKIDTLLPLVKWHNQYAKDKLFHVNMFPGYAAMYFSGHTLDEYLQYYVDTILAQVESPKTLGLDNYPLITNNTEENNIRPSYLSDLLTLSTIAKNYNDRTDKTSEITVGFCVQAFVDNGIRDIECKEDISFQTNTCLAMGAKYLEYFTYRTVANMLGLVQDGEKRDVYTYVKEVNEELKKWDHVIMAFDWQGAMTVDGTDAHENKESFESVQDKVLKQLEKVQNVESRLDTLIGEFKDQDGRYGYMVVNYTEPTNHRIDYVDMTFTEAQKALVYQGGEPKIYNVENNQLQLRVEAGDAAFVIPLSE